MYTYIKVLVRKHEGKGSLGRLKHRGENIIKLDILDVGCGGMDWIELAHIRNRW
jgi:2-polyprenyl-3-methyl-5-hydroxy-6-metoxy-1,4-benzoquinol methylase